MNDDDRTERWLTDLSAELATATLLAERGKAAFDMDAAIPLAFEALSNRIGDLCKKLVAAEPGRFVDPIWSQAAKNRDFVVHHYGRVDRDALWNTVTVGFQGLAIAIDSDRARHSTR